jgi:hypothetical protein
MLRVMRAARQVDGDAFCGSGSASGECGADGAPRSLDHLDRPGEAYGALLGGRKLARDDPPDVFLAMRQQQILVGCCRRFTQRSPGKILLDPFVQPGVLGHREAVARRERQDESIAVERFQRGLPSRAGILTRPLSEATVTAARQFRQDHAAFSLLLQS